MDRYVNPAMPVAKIPTSATPGRKTAGAQLLTLAIAAGVTATVILILHLYLDSGISTAALDVISETFDKGF